ncbi:hypothetical protein BWK60_01980 [Flavobacterium covae]|uniref:hypothetical protein n=1 Tax=Flavobacterium covae TaxID=2906076 RepID=UPI000B4CCD4D|nr:hypothetical protein [Flavobacterium covae]OWP87782.1 hypothetical protein BWK60_01980 [Flavobacterium covae]
MIVAKEFPDKKFESKDELFTALVDNKAELIATKKMQTKEADAVFNIVKSKENTIGLANKTESNSNSEPEPNKLKLKLVINTTNILDSHSDVHIKGIWNETIKEQKDLYLLQEHQMKFDSIISDNISAKVETMKWKDLGFSYGGDTEALIFETTIDKNRNSFMFDQYLQGFVKNHSVGMCYVKIELAINSESKWYREEKEIWDKYISQIANKEEAEAKGYFWAVTEAKIIEGSAVVRGSNIATPTISVEAVEDTSSKQEPSRDTQKAEEMLKELLTKI